MTLPVIYRWRGIVSARSVGAGPGIRHNTIHRAVERYFLHRRSVGAVVMFTLITCTVAFPATAQTTTPYFFAPYTTVAPTIDGIITNDPGWTKAQPQALKFAMVLGPETNAETVYMVHDGTFIYIGIVSNTTDGGESQGWVRFDGNNSGVLDGSAGEPHVDVHIDQAAPSGFAGYTNYAYLSGCESYGYVSRPAGAESACTNSDNLTYEFKVPLSDLTTTPGHELRVLLMSQQSLGVQTYKTYMYPSTDTCIPLNWARVGLEKPNQIGWHKKTDSGPEPRVHHQMTYDRVRKAVILFGGMAGSQVFGDTWEWNGDAWTKRLSEGPSPRYGGAMGYDSVGQKSLLYGGATSDSNIQKEMWEWDGTTWAMISDTGPALIWPAIAYDSDRQRVVEFGGDNGGYQAGTWEWDGTTWSQLPVTGPTARAGHRMVYDTARKRTILFGGGGPTSTNETWEWDGASWNQLTPALAPPPRYEFGMAYDPDRGRTVVFGGQDLLKNRDTQTWEWDGVSWTKTVDQGPGSRVTCAMAYDEEREQMVLFGGINDSGVLGDTWIYEGPRATHLAFTEQPGGALSATPLNPQPVVRALRDDGTIDTAFNGYVSIRIRPGTGNGRAGMIGVTTVQATNGCATFTNASVCVSGTGYQLQAFANPVLVPVDSTPFDIAVNYPWGDLNKDECFNLGDVVFGLRVWAGLAVPPS